MINYSIRILRDKLFIRTLLVVHVILIRPCHSGLQDPGGCGIKARAGLALKTRVSQRLARQPAKLRTLDGDHQTN